MTSKNQQDIIFIHGLQCDCVIGVWPWEKQVTQTLILDIDLATDILPAAESDDLKDTLDYKKLADRVIAHAESSRDDLIETLIEAIADIILREFAVTWVRIKLDKGGVVKRVRQVGIIIERGARA